MDVKLCENSNLSESVTLSLSRCDTIGLYYGARLRTPFFFLSFFLSFPGVNKKQSFQLRVESSFIVI